MGEIIIQIAVLIGGYAVVTVMALLLSDHHADMISEYTSRKFGPYKASVRELIGRVFALCFLSFFTLIFKYELGEVPYPNGIYELGLYFLHYAALFGIIFNISLNLKRGEDWDYISTTNNKFSDKVFSGYFFLQQGFYVVVMIVTLIVITKVDAL